jgi:predicted nucleic acid-binding protein
MRILVDTNILDRLSQPDHAQHAAGVRAAKSLRDGHHELRIVPQVIYEYWVVGTRPAARNGLGLTPEVVASKLHDFKALFPVLRDERGILERWEQLVRAHQVLGKPAHDARLAAAMQRHGLTHLLTFNGGNFSRFAFIQVLDPIQVAQTP